MGGRAPNAVDHLIDLIYDAALDGAGWQRALRGIAEATRSSGALLFTPHLLEAGGAGWQTHEIDHALFGPYCAYYYQHDIAQDLATDVMKRMGREVVIPVDQYLPRAQFESSLIYNEFFAPNGIGVILALNVPENAALEMPQVDLALYRPPGGEPYRDAEIRMLEALTPHLKRALTLHRRLARRNVLGQAACNALDQFSVGVALLRADRSVLHLNPEAERIVNSHDGLGVVAGRLVASAADCPLREVLAAPQGGATSVSRPSGSRDYLLVVTPVRGNAATFCEEGPASIVFITDPEVRRTSREALMRSLWRLTAAEARVATALLDGLTPKQIAESFHVAEPTVRTQIRMILTKTDTSRQSEFIRLASAMVPAPGAPEATVA